MIVQIILVNVIVIVIIILTINHNNNSSDTNDNHSHTNKKVLRICISACKGIARTPTRPRTHARTADGLGRSGGFPADGPICVHVLLYVLSYNDANNN